MTPSSRADAWDYYSDDDTTVAPSYPSSMDGNATIKGDENPEEDFPFTSTVVSSVVLALTAAEIVAQLSRLIDTTIETETADMSETPNMPYGM